MTATLPSRTKSKKKTAQKEIEAIVTKKILPLIIAIAMFVAIWLLLTLGESPRLP